MTQYGLKFMAVRGNFLKFILLMESQRPAMNDSVAFISSTTC